jgi:hypothetical protein
METMNRILDTKEVQGESWKELRDSWKAQGCSDLRMKEEYNLIF